MHPERPAGRPASEIDDGAGRARQDPRDYARDFARRRAQPDRGTRWRPRTRALPVGSATRRCCAGRLSPRRREGRQLGRYTAHPLLVLGDDITTDHISPASAIPADSLVADFLVERGDDRNDLNVFASRRGNWEVMLRAAFHNKSVVNLPRRRGPAGSVAHTVHVPSGEVLPMWEAAAALSRRRRTGGAGRRRALRHRLVARLGRQGPAPAGHPRRARRQLRAHPPLQPHRHGHPAADAPAEVRARLQALRPGDRSRSTRPRTRWPRAPASPSCCAPPTAASRSSPPAPRSRRSSRSSCCATAASSPPCCAAPLKGGHRSRAPALNEERNGQDRNGQDHRGRADRRTRRRRDGPHHVDPGARSAHPAARGRAHPAVRPLPAQPGADRGPGHLRGGRGRRRAPGGREVLHHHPRRRPRGGVRTQPTLALPERHGAQRAQRGALPRADHHRLRARLVPGWCPAGAGRS